MSRTPDVGVVGIKYWAYMAAAMTNCLRQIIDGQEPIIPVGILYDAKLFFNIVLERKTGTHFDNHLAQANAHQIAWEVLNDCPVLRVHTLKGANRRFCEFAEFLKRLGKQPRVRLSEGWGRKPAPSWIKKNKKTAEDLRDFFAALVRKDERDGRR